jgi:nucleolar MIF4G domain-containing protein 1
VPLSFARDGLDYILGALEPGRAGGLYDSSGEDEDQGQDQEEGQTLPERDPDSSGDEEQGAGQTLPERDLESGSELDREEDAGAGAQPRDEDVDPESREEAEGGARENRGRKRVRFAADEERRQSSSEGDDTKHQVHREQPAADLLGRPSGLGGAEYSAVLTLVQTATSRAC